MNLYKVLINTKNISLLSKLKQFQNNYYNSFKKTIQIFIFEIQ